MTMTNDELLAWLDSAASEMDVLGEAAAAIRALEAKVREVKQLHDNALKIVYQACADDVAREVDRVEALAAEVELLRTQAGLPPKYPTALVMHDAHANMVNAELRADRDRLAGEVFNLRADVMQWQTYFKTMVEFSAHNHARLTSELAGERLHVAALEGMWKQAEADLEKARENEARYLAVKAFCEANAHVSAHSRRHRWSMEVNALDANTSFDAAIDAARSAGGEG